MALQRSDRDLPALTVLALLLTGPRHTYEMHRLMIDTHKDFVTGLPRSMYHAVERLLRDELIRVVGTDRRGARPERTVYALTDAGRAELAVRVRRLLEHPEPDATLFVAALSFVGCLPVPQARAALAARRDDAGPPRRGGRHRTRRGGAGGAATAARGAGVRDRPVERRARLGGRARRRHRRRTTHLARRRPRPAGGAPDDVTRSGPGGDAATSPPGPEPLRRRTPRTSTARNCVHEPNRGVPSRPAHPTGGTTMSVSIDRTPIDTVLAELATAWDAGDAAAYAGLFTPDATYVVFDGTVLHGAEAIEDVHRWLFDGPLRNSRWAGRTRARPPKSASSGLTSLSRSSPAGSGPRGRPISRRSGRRWSPWRSSTPRTAGGSPRSRTPACRSVGDEAAVRGVGAGARERRRRCGL